MGAFEISRQYKIPFIPYDFPGFNDTYNSIFEHRWARIIDHDLQGFGGLLESINNIASNDSQTILFHSWNDFSESTFMEPSVEFGYSYLETVNEKLSPNLIRNLSLELGEASWCSSGSPQIVTSESNAHIGAKVAMVNSQNHYIQSITVSPGQCYTYCTTDTNKWDLSYVESNWSLRGDFDIQVDFDTSQYPLPPADRAETFFTVVLDGYSYCFMHTRAWNGLMEYLAWNGQTQESVGYRWTADNAAAIRIIRKGTSIKGLCWERNHWVEYILLEGLPVADAKVRLGACTRDTQSITHTSFDNFIVNMGHVPSTPTPTPTFTPTPTSTSTPTPTSAPSDTGWKFPSAQDGDWGWASRVYVEDSIYAYCDEEGQFYSNFNFNVPSGSTIKGIEVGIRIYGPEAGYMSCALIWDYDAESNPGDGEWTAFKRIAFTTSPAWYYYGGSSDRWGRSWNASEFSNANFGALFGGWASYIDAIKIKVYYTPPPPTPTPGWPMFQYNPEHSGKSSYRGPTIGVLHWSYRFFGGHTEAPPSIGSDGRIYTAGGGNDPSLSLSELHRMYCLNTDGTIAWSYASVYWSYNHSWGAESRYAILDSAPALSPEGNIYFGSKGGVDYSAFYALNSNGGLKWTYKTGNDVQASNTMGPNGELYFGTAGKLYALDSGGTIKWSYAAGTGRSSPAAWSGDGRIAGIGDALYLMNSNGSLRWSYRGIGGSHSPSFGGSRRIYTGSAEGNGNAYAFNSNGTLTWSYMTFTGAYCDAVTADEADGRIYAGSIRPQGSGTPVPQKIYALNTSGALVWSYRMGDRPDSILMGTIALDAEGRIYHGSADSKMYAWNMDGTLLWSYRTCGGEDWANIQGGPGLSADGKLYISDANGAFYAFGPTPTPTESRTFALYGAVDWRENWVSVPFNDTGISTTVDLGNSIRAAFSSEGGDELTILLRDGAGQTELETSGAYVDGEWRWYPSEGYAISIGAMYKVWIDRTDEDAFEWTISGTVPAAGTVVFTLYGPGDDADNENWILLPFDKGDLTTTVVVGESIGAAYSPANGDNLTIGTFDIEHHWTVETMGTYNGSTWSWDPSEGYAVSTGMPFIVRPYRDGGMPPITWP